VIQRRNQTNTKGKNPEEQRRGARVQAGENEKRKEVPYGEGGEGELEKQKKTVGREEDKIYISTGKKTLAPKKSRGVPRKKRKSLCIHHEERCGRKCTTH